MNFLIENLVLQSFVMALDTYIVLKIIKYIFQLT